MVVSAQSLPFGVGRFTRAWKGLVAALVVLVGLGVFAYVREVGDGLGVTGMRDVGPMRGSTWALYIAFAVFFIGVSFAGITIAAFVRLAKVDALRPVGRMAELLTVVSLILGGLIILADLGHPLRGIVNLLRYARPQSPFFGTFTLVIAGYLFASLVYLYLGGRRDAARCAETPSRLQRFHRWWAAGYHDSAKERSRHARASLWLAIAIVPLLVTAHSTLGFVFGLQIGRPGWNSALQAPAFVILAGVSGVGALIVIAAVVRRTLPAQDRLGERVFRFLGGMLGLLLLAYLYFMVVELLTAAYQGDDKEKELTSALLSGRYAWIYWGSVAALVLPLVAIGVQWLKGRMSIPLLVAAGVLVNLAAIGKRFLIVVPSQTDGALLPYGEGHYGPTLGEVGVIVGLIALGTLLYVVFAKVFPLLEVEAEPAAPAAPASTVPAETDTADARRRTTVAVVMVVAGFVLQAVSYLVFAAPFGATDGPDISNPRVDFAPLLFILGVVLVFAAAVVYELLPERRRAAV